MSHLPNLKLYWSNKDSVHEMAVVIRDGTMAHWVTHSVGVSLTQDLRVGASEASAIHPTHINVCVCGAWTYVCIHKALFPSSPCSTQLFYLQCTLMERGCGQNWRSMSNVDQCSNFVKLAFCLPSWLCKGTNNARTPPYYRHTSVSANTRTLPYLRY